MAGDKSPQIFTFETMSVVLYAMLESGVTLGKKHYEMMSAVDGERGVDSFQHQFRAAKARAKDLQEQAKSGEVGTPVKKTKGGRKAATPGSGKDGPKRGRTPWPSIVPRRADCMTGKKNKKSDDEDEEVPEESPTKKTKAEAEDEDVGF